jgi:hypothetical protein
MKIKKKIVMPGMRRKVTFIKLKIFRTERRRNKRKITHVIHFVGKSELRYKETIYFNPR